MAERAAEWVAVECLGCIGEGPAAPVRAVRTKFQHQDLWGADVMAMKPDGSKVYIQVTCGGQKAVQHRRRKLEHPWQDTDTVLLLQMVERLDPANATRKERFFRVHILAWTDVEVKDGRWRALWTWRVEERALPVAREWLKARRKEEG